MIVRVLSVKLKEVNILAIFFSGEWSGPEGIMPSDDTLKDWKVSKSYLAGVKFGV